MDLTLTEDQQLLAESARRFLERHCPTDLVRTAQTTAAGYPTELWDRVGELGWPGIALPEAVGGSGQGLLDLIVLAEELGRAACSLPLLGSITLGALPLLWSGPEELRDRWLPRLASGEAIATLALLEPDAGDEWSDRSMAPSDDGGVSTLSGTKILVPYGAAADLLLVAVSGPGVGMSLVAVEPGPGVSTERHDAVGGDPLDAVSFDAVPVGPEAIVDEATGGRPVIYRTLDYAAVVQAAYAVGLAERALDLSVDHARHREQFGRPIGSFQAVAHRCSDMRIDIDACRVLIQQAAWFLDRDGAAPGAVSTAKAYANDAIRRVFVNAHQVHGAIGFSEEYDLQLFTRRAKAFELNLGTTARHQERIAEELGL